MRYREWWQDPGSRIPHEGVVSPLATWPHSGSGHCQSDTQTADEPEGTNLILQQRELTTGNRAARWTPGDHVDPVTWKVSCMLTSSAAFSLCAAARDAIYRVSSMSLKHMVSLITTVIQRAGCFEVRFISKKTEAWSHVLWNPSWLLSLRMWFNSSLRD